MSILQPLRTRLESLARNETNKAIAIADTQKDVKGILNVTRPMLDAAEVIVRGVVEIHERAGMIDRRIGEFDAGETVDKLRDLQLILQHLEMLNRLEYVDVATRLDVLDKELLFSTFEELAHLPSGQEKLLAIKQVLGELLE